MRSGACVCARVCLKFSKQASAGISRHQQASAGISRHWHIKRAHHTRVLGFFQRRQEQGRQDIWSCQQYAEKEGMWSKGKRGSLQSTQSTAAPPQRARAHASMHTRSPFHLMNKPRVLTAKFVSTPASVVVRSWSMQPALLMSTSRA